MHWEDVDGVRIPKRVGGHAALDLCNTLAGWGEAPARRSEWLGGYDSVAVWAEAAGLLRPGEAARLRRAAHREPDQAADVVRRVRQLRRNVRTAVTDPRHARGLQQVAAVAQEAASRLTLVSGERPEWRLPPAVDAPLLQAARAASDFLTSGDLSAVRGCPGKGCGWLFLDPRGRRRWCSMAWCGNRAKVRAHAERTRG
jgi:predicted RNA-binding Zn ribbon-like protein